MVSLVSSTGRTYPSQTRRRRGRSRGRVTAEFLGLPQPGPDLLGDRLEPGERRGQVQLIGGFAGHRQPPGQPVRFGGGGLEVVGERGQRVGFQCPTVARSRA